MVTPDSIDGYGSIYYKLKIKLENVGETAARNIKEGSECEWLRPEDRDRATVSFDRIRPRRVVTSLDKQSEREIHDDTFQDVLAWPGDVAPGDASKLPNAQFARVTCILLITYDDNVDRKHELKVCMRSTDFRRDLVMEGDVSPLDEFDCKTLKRQSIFSRLLDSTALSLGDRFGDWSHYP
jgi:hypothetical protein